MASTVSTYRFGRFELRLAQRRLLVDGTDAALGARAYDMLVALIERRERVVGSDELFDLVWPGLVVEDNNLRQQVAALRKVLGAQAIATVPGRGYRFALTLDAEDTGAPGRSTAAPPADAMPNNLPLNLPALIGRAPELASVVELLAGTHLLTLTGAGGIGKTRLALAAAEAVKREYPHGVWFVELAPIADASLVPRVVAAALGVHEEPGRPLLDTLLDFLRHRELLVVLDNCEHVIEACARWAETLLHTSAATRVLATSREALGITGETTWRVPSLQTALPGSDPSADELMAHAATQLFVERAVAAEPAFRLTPDNVPAVARLCHQLDGIPLALELAAARVKAMRVEQVAERLSDRFALLTRGSRTALQRHQTLRSLIDWSHDLLTEPERVLLRRLSVFAGSWTIEAAEAVCSDGALASADVLDLLAHLVEKSLVVPDEQSAEPRYRMLETIRQYALDKLVDAGEHDTLRTRHLSFLVEFAEGVRTRLNGEDQLRWHARAAAELDNVRVALAASLQLEQVELGLRLISPLHRHWYKNMHWKEMVDWQERLAIQARGEGPPTPYLARTYYMAAMLATNYDPAAGRVFAEEGVRMSREIGFHEGAAWSLMWLGYIDSRKRDAATAELFDESLREGDLIEDPWRRAFLLAQCLICYAGYETLMGRDESAEAMCRECEMQIAKIGNDLLYVGHSRALTGTMATRRGEYERAGKLLAQALELYRVVDSKFDIAICLAQQGFLALRQNDPARALQLFKESLPPHRNYPTSPWVTKGLAHLLIAYAACERWQVAAQLAGVMHGADGTLGAAPAELSGRVAREYEDSVARTREQLGAAFHAEVDAGRRMTREQAIELVLAP